MIYSVICLFSLFFFFRPPHFVLRSVLPSEGKPELLQKLYRTKISQFYIYLFMVYFQSFELPSKRRSLHTTLRPRSRQDKTKLEETNPDEEEEDADAEDDVMDESNAAQGKRKRSASARKRSSKPRKPDIVVATVGAVDGQFDFLFNLVNCGSSTQKYNL